MHPKWVIIFCCLLALHSPRAQPASKLLQMLLLFLQTLDTKVRNFRMKIIISTFFSFFFFFYFVRTFLLLGLEMTDVNHLWMPSREIPHTVNFLNIQTPKTFVVITLKFELCGSTIRVNESKRCRRNGKQCRP